MQSFDSPSLSTKTLAEEAPSAVPKSATNQFEKLWIKRPTTMTKNRTRRKKPQVSFRRR